MKTEKRFLPDFLIGIFLSFISSIILFYCLGIILSTTSIPEKIIIPAVLTITGISILISTSIVMLKNNTKGLIKGGMIGVSYFSILYLISSISLKSFDINIYTCLIFIVTFMCGAVGGIVGMNIKSYKK